MLNKLPQVPDEIYQIIKWQTEQILVLQQQVRQLMMERPQPEENSNKISSTKFVLFKIYNIITISIRNQLENMIVLESVCILTFL